MSEEDWRRWVGGAYVPTEAGGGRGVCGAEAEFTPRPLRGPSLRTSRDWPSDVRRARLRDVCV